MALGAVMLVALAAAVYWAGWRSAPKAGVRRIGMWLGVVLGLLWMVEIGVNNVFPADRVALGTRDVIDDVLWAIIWLLTIGVAAIVARRAGRTAAGASVGLWSGIVSGGPAIPRREPRCHDYLGALQKLFSMVRGVENQATVAEDADVVRFSVLDTPVARAPVAEWYTVEDGGIVELRAYFDARPFAPAR